MHDVSNNQDLSSYQQVKEALDFLFTVTWDRWHPNNPKTQGAAPPVVYAALEDLRPLVREASGLWDQLGYALRRQQQVRGEGARRNADRHAASMQVQV